MWGPGLPTDAAGSATFPERTWLWGGGGAGKRQPRRGQTSSSGPTGHFFKSVT